MKNIIYILGLFSLLIFSSCKKFLSVEPKDYVSDANTIFDKASAQTALRGTYRALADNSYYGERFVEVGFWAGGDWINKTTGGAANIVNQNFRADDAYFENVWSAIYSTINSANNVISKVPLVEDVGLDDSLRNNIIGQAYFLRALSYFDLIRSWGGVPLVLVPSTSATGGNSTVARSSIEDSWAQVESDLDSAFQLLSYTVNRVIATKYTVVALRARLHLYKKEWAEAEKDATVLIENNQDYTLLSPYNSWFGQQNEESIFELEFSEQNPITIYAEMQIPANSGAYRYAPSQTLVNLLTDQTIGGGRSELVAKNVQAGITTWYGNLYTKKTDPTYVLRIAEQYLIRAEARTEQGVDLSGALKDLNVVRERAGLKDVSYKTKSEILQAIFDERRVEFALEPFRWFDLARTGNAVSILDIPNYKLVFPIPSTEITLNPNLVQNPGYNGTTGESSDSK